MEANFSLQTSGQIPAFKGLVTVKCLHNVFKIDEDEFWQAVVLIFGEDFLDHDWRPRSNLDISSLFLPLGFLQR